MRRKLFFIIFSFLFVASHLFAKGGRSYRNQSAKQSEISFYASVGPSYCFGDVGGLSVNSVAGIDDLKIQYTRPSYTVGIRHSFESGFGYKALVQYGHYLGSDETSRFNKNDVKRDYAYESTVSQFILLGEYAFLENYFYNGNPYKMYAMLGAGVFSSSARNTGAAIRAKDSYKLTDIAAVVPFGVGFETKISDKVGLGTEVMWNYFFSDYVDGVSPSTSSHNDALGSVLFTFTYHISGKTNRKYSCRCYSYE